MRKKNKGFALVELLIIIGIIVVLAAVAIPLVYGAVNNAQHTEKTEWTAELQAAVNSYKTVQVKNTNQYPRLYREDKDGYNESKNFIENVGKNSIPGYSVNIYNADNSVKTAEGVYSEIRRECMLAVKAFTDIDVKEDYYLTDNAKEKEYAFVYYYLTGEVKQEKYDELKYYSIDSPSGSVNTDEYWVFLTLPTKFQEGHETETGSGFAGLIGDTDGDGLPDDPIVGPGGEDIDNNYLNFYVKVVDFATGDPIESAQGETITVRLVGEENRRADVGKSGIVYFQNVKSGTYSVEVKSDLDNWLAYPDEDIYVDESEKGGLVVIKRSVKEDGTLTRYIGDYIQNPYIVRMKRGTLGSMEFAQLVPKWDGTQWVIERETVTDGTIMTVDFAADPTDPTTTARSQTYVFDTREGTLPLLNGNQFLTFGKYTMSITSTNNIFYFIQRQIVSELWGIDDLPVGRYDEIQPYTYVVDVKRAYSKFKGTLLPEEVEQVIGGSPDETDYLGYWDDNSTKTAPTITTTIKLKQGGVVKYSTVVNPDGTYELDGIADGTYDIEISNEYNNSFVPKDFPKKITTEGGIYIANGTIKDEDYKTTNLTVKVLFKDNNDPIQNAQVSIRRFGFGEETEVKQTVNTNGQTVFNNIKTGYYQVSYTVPYNNTTYYLKVFVGTSGKTITLYPLLLDSTLTFKVQDEYGVTSFLPNGNVRLQLTNIETNTKYAVKTLKVPTSGIVTFTARVGTYKLSILADNHYATNTIWLSSFDAFDSTKSNLVPFSNDYGTKVISFDISSESKHAGKVVYRKGSTNMTVTADNVSDVQHERYCEGCGYHWTPADCVFDKTVKANVSSIVEDIGNTHHRVKCKICLINTEDQLHDFSGDYRNSEPHTQIDNGKHARACLYCPDNGYDGDRRNVDDCSNTTIIKTTTHIYKCNECGNTDGGWTEYDHNYTKNTELENDGYKQVDQKTSAITGTHNLPCAGCDSRGWIKTLNAKGSCSNKETITDTQHKQECILCKNYIQENHNFNGEYLNVEHHTTVGDGTHNRLCFNCTGRGFNGVLNATEACGNEIKVETNKHVYKCPLCEDCEKYDHDYTGEAINVIKHTTKTNGTHKYKCDICGSYGFENVLNATEPCKDYDETIVYDTQHSVRCKVCTSETKEDHKYLSKTQGGASDNITPHTSRTNGTHRNFCKGCETWGVGNKWDNDNKGSVTIGCTDVTTTTETEHTYTCPDCESTSTYYHDFSGACQNQVAHTSPNNGEHNWLCLGCSSYGIGSGINAEKNGTVSCGNNTSIESTTHTYTCPTCKSKKSYSHNFACDVEIVTEYTSSGFGEHDYLCTGAECTARGASNSTRKGSTNKCPSTGHKTSSGHYFECEDCDNYRSDEHRLGDEYGANCVTKGRRDCAYCSYYVLGNKDSSNHVALKEKCVQERSCFQDGKYETYCSVSKGGCGAQKISTRTETQYGRHGTWVYIKETKAATCTIAGSKQYKCTRCGVLENRATAALGHSWGTTYTSAGSSGHYRKCTRCSAKNSTESHNWSSSYTPNGSTGHYKTCTKCSEKLTESHSICGGTSVKLTSNGTYVSSDGRYHYNGYCKSCNGSVLFKSVHSDYKSGDTVSWNDNGGEFTSSCPRCKYCKWFSK